MSRSSSDVSQLMQTLELIEQEARSCDRMTSTNLAEIARQARADQFRREITRSERTSRTFVLD